ncbi:MAG: hypothetical protein ACKVLC_01345 [Phycisphaerales bacterium]
MEVRRIPLIVSGLIVAASATTAMADLHGVSWTVTTSEWGVTFQFFADLDAGNQLNAVYGDADNALPISNSGMFYQSAFGGPIVAGMNPAFFPISPSMVYDSFVTIGFETNVGNAMLDIGADFTNFEAGGQVLIGRFTVATGEGVFGTINMQGKNADDSNWYATDVNFIEVSPHNTSHFLYSIHFAVNVGKRGTFALSDADSLNCNDLPFCRSHVH